MYHDKKTQVDERNKLKKKHDGNVQHVNICSLLWNYDQ